MKPCPHCQNPVGDFWRTQCMWKGLGQSPCSKEYDERVIAQVSRDNRAACLTLIAILAVLTYFLLTRK